MSRVETSRSTAGVRSAHTGVPRGTKAGFDATCSLLIAVAGETRIRRRSRRGFIRAGHPRDIGNIRRNPETGPKSGKVACHQLSD